MIYNRHSNCNRVYHYPAHTNSDIVDTSKVPYLSPAYVKVLLESSLVGISEKMLS